MGKGKRLGEKCQLGCSKKEKKNPREDLYGGKGRKRRGRNAIKLRQPLKLEICGNVQIKSQVIKTKPEK